MQHHELESYRDFVVANFKVKVTARAHVISFYYIISTVDSLASKLSLMIHHHQKPKCLMKKKKWIAIFRVKVTGKGKNIMLVQMIFS